MHVGFFDRPENNPGSLLTKLSSDAANVNNIIISTIGVFVQSIVMLIVANAIGLYFDWRIDLITLFFTPILYFSSYLYFKISESEDATSEEFEFQAGELLSECVCNSKTVYSFNFQTKAVKLYKIILKMPHQNLQQTSLLNGAIYGFSQGIIYIPFGIVFLVGGMFIYNKTGTYSDILNSFFTLSTAVLYLGMSQKYVGDLSSAKRSLNNLMKIQNEPSLLDPMEENAGNIKPEVIKGKIEFRNVTFAYPTRDVIVLKNLSFEINPGQIAAFVGPSGSGKSTIVQLIERFYDAKTVEDDLIQGQILIDDIEIQKYDIKQIRRFFSLVEQEPVIFKRSVKDNILYGKLEATDEEVLQAAKTAKISHLLDKGPNDHHVSGGEKQRIAIARAIIRDPKILLLDEATSALDRNTELEIQESLDQLMKNKTCLVVAHR